MVPSPADKVNDFVALHDVHAPYPAHVLLPYDICTHCTHVSIGHVILSVTLTDVVVVAQLLIVKNDHHIVVGESLATKISFPPLLVNDVVQKLAVPPNVHAI